MKRLISICVVVVLFSMGYTKAGTWTTLDCPYGSYNVSTQATGISGNNIVGVSGEYGWWGSSRGFLYDGTTWTILGMPGSFSTWTTAISGDNIVGGYNTSLSSGWRDTRGFLYNITYNTWTPLDYPGGSVTSITGISGSNIVGSYLDNNGSTHGFLSNGETWMTLDMPGANGTSILSISGNNIVGIYDQISHDEAHGFLYNLESCTWTALDMPGSIGTVITGISGNKMIGYYKAPITGFDYNFLYDGANWLILDDLPGSPNGISGNTIVGSYSNHGYVYEIPEPATLLFLTLGGLFLRKRKA
jgi:hypothetical protein